MIKSMSGSSLRLLRGFQGRCSGFRLSSCNPSQKWLQSRSLFVTASLPMKTTASKTQAKKEIVRDEEEKKDGLGAPAAGEPEYKESFGKEIFLGKFDDQMLIFPEALGKEQHETLHAMLEPIERFFNDKVDSKKIDQDAKIPDEVLKGLKDLGLYGQQVPHEYGGLGLNATEYARLQEIISLDGSIAVTLAAHQTIGYKGLLLYGNEEQKQKYLPSLASGHMVAAFALTEPTSGSDAGSIKTRATLSTDGTHWILNGSKIWISNGGTADFFTVFAKTADDNIEGFKSSKIITAFLVERKFGGLTNGKPEDKLGIRGSNTAEVHFENVKVPVANVLGQEGDGFKIAMNILNSGRFSMGSASAGFLKKLLALVTEHAINRKQFGKSLSEFPIIQEKLVRIATDIYVMEAMAYTTAGLIDSGLYKDCAQEAAMVKVFSSEAAYNGINECLQILGGLGYMKDLPVERALRDARIMSIFEGTNEILRLLVALNGIKHAGKGLKELVKKLRQPFQYPNLVWKRMISQSRNLKGNPALTLQLKRFVHPTLEPPADQIEYCTLRLQFAVETVLQEYGPLIVDQQLMLKRLAEIAIDIYAMTCAVSRASRAYCIGLANAQTELWVATLFCIQARTRIDNHMNFILGPIDNGDNFIKSIADDIFSSKGYCLEHPLTKNFW